MELFLRNTPSVVNIANIGRALFSSPVTPLWTCLLTMELLCCCSTVGPGYLDVEDISISQMQNYLGQCSASNVQNVL